MKLLAVLFSILLSTRLIAGEILLLEIPNSTFDLPSSYDHGVSGNFKVNINNLHSWIELEVSDSRSNSQARKQRFVVYPQDLTYSPSEKIISMKIDNEEHVCATVSLGYFSKRPIVKPTGECVFIHKYVQVTTEDYAGSRTHTLLQIFVKTR